jgi:hypothetical protein
MHRIRIALALATLGAGAAWAQGGARPVPTDPAATVPPAEYRSAFTEYRRSSEPKLAPWREVNEEVGRLGGHRGHVRGEGRAPGAASGASAAPAAKGGHSAHGAQQ